MLWNVELDGTNDQLTYVIVRIPVVVGARCEARRKDFNSNDALNVYFFQLYLMNINKINVKICEVITWNLLVKVRAEQDFKNLYRDL